MHLITKPCPKYRRYWALGKIRSTIGHCFRITALVRMWSFKVSEIHKMAKFILILYLHNHHVTLLRCAITV